MSASEADAWSRLEAELDQWRAAGRSATLWWRDDDAGALSPALQKLFALSATHGVPLALATVPAWATAETAKAVAASGAEIGVIQHGYAHANYAPDGQKKFELGPERPAAIVVAELAQGWQLLEAHFGPHFWPAIVPPWNRMALYLPPFLAELRFRGLSQFGARTRREPVRGLVQANTHVDIVFWKSAPARFAGAAKLVDEFVHHLAARRGGAADPAEPTGLLTHHAAHDADCWAFLETLFARLARHKAVTWLPAASVFAQS